jgi:anti-sigma-K factor RskA
MTDYFADVGAYLLGALTPEETAAFERELERNDELRADVEHLRIAADALPASSIQMAPPPGLKDRVMAVVNAEAELLRAAGPEADRVPAPRAPSRRWFAWRPAFGLAAAALATAFVVGIIVFGGDGGDRVIEASTGNAQLIQRRSGHSTLTAANLPLPGPGRVYQVWLQRKGDDPQPTNALFGVGKDGTASVDVPGDIEDVDTVMVTSEPDGGSQTPSRAPIIVAHPA